MSWGAALGSAFSGVLNFGLGMSNQQNQAVMNREQLDWAKEQFARNEALQREFATHGLRWKVADAKEAGIHPMFAMGAPVASYTPSVANYNPVSSGGMSVPDFGALGQNIERAINAGSTQQERMEKLHEARHMASLQTERAELENTYIKAQIARTMSQIGPPFPRPGTSSAGGGVSGDAVTVQGLGTYEPKPPEITNPNPGNTGTTAGPSQPQNQWAVTSHGTLQPFPAKDLKVEDEFGAPLMARWILSEALPHNWSNKKPPEAVWKKAFPGALDVEWSYREQGFVPVYGGSRSGRFVGPQASRPGIRAGMHYIETMRGR